MWAFDWYSGYAFELWTVMYNSILKFLEIYTSLFKFVCAWISVVFSQSYISAACTKAYNVT